MPSFSIPALSIGSFNDYQMRGNFEAGRGNFDAAISNFKKAEHLDLFIIKNCRGEFNRIQILAAKEAKNRMLSHHLSKIEASNWYQTHSMSLWTVNRCNTP